MEKPGSKISKHNFSIVISEAWVSANPREYSVWFYLQIRVQSVCPAMRKKIFLLKVVWHTSFSILQPNVGFPATAFMDVEMESYILKELAMKVIHSTDSCWQCIALQDLTPLIVRDIFLLLGTLQLVIS